MKLLLGTGNAGKLKELRRLLSEAGIKAEVLGLKDLPTLPPEVVEDAPDFEGNAKKKASTLAKATGLRTLADDSGLEVDALGGAPGVHSARYAGTHGDDAGNNAKLLKAMANQENRDARFRCVLALASATGEIEHIEHGTCEGRIGDALQGDGGFGYDPLFWPSAHEGKAMAELTSEEKGAISHRGQATRKMTAWLKGNLD